MTRALAQCMLRASGRNKMQNLNYNVDDEFGNQISAGLSSYDAAIQVARKYLSAHSDAPAVTIYEDCEGGKSWDLDREEALA